MAAESPRGGRARLALLGALFFLSGAAGLVDQVVWLRYLGLVFGNTTFATATLLAVFLGGLGAGAALFGRVAARLARPLVAYGLLELGVALWALASPALFAGIDQAYVALYRAFGAAPSLFGAGRMLLALLALGPPTLLMGGSLPLLLADVERSAAPAEQAGGRGERAAAWLYALNTLGALAGVAFAGFFSIRVIGLRATLLVASTAQALVALAAVLAARRRATPAPAAAPPAAAAGAPRRGPRRARCSPRRSRWAPRASPAKCSGRASWSSTSARASTRSA